MEDIGSIHQEQLLEKALNLVFQEGNFNSLKEVIHSGMDVNIRLENDETALMKAAHLGNLAAVRILVEAGADVNAETSGGYYALWNAANQGRIEVFDYLAPLTSSSLREDAEKILGKGLILRQRLDDKALEDFIEAAAFGDLNTVINLISHGIDINAFGADGCTALYVAAICGKVDVVRFLSRAGANTECGRESDNETPLIAASGNNLLMQNPELKQMQLEIVKTLIETGANVNAITTDGWNALEAAANIGNLEVVKLLLQAGADVNAKDYQGDTALGRARKSKYAEIVQLLQNAGAVDNGE